MKHEIMTNKFLELTPEELVILKKVGIKVTIPKEKKEVRKSRKNTYPTAPEEYILQIFQSCQLCKTEKTYFFHMKRKGNCLQSILLLGKEYIPGKVRIFAIKSCKSCKILLRNPQFLLDELRKRL